MITKIKELFKFLFVTEKDKGDHFVVGIIIGIALSNILYNFFYWVTEWPHWMPLALVPVMVMFAVWLAAFLKELYDESKGRLRNFQDIKWTMIGGAIGLIIISLFYI